METVSTTGTGNISSNISSRWVKILDVQNEYTLIPLMWNWAVGLPLLIPTVCSLIVNGKQSQQRAYLILCTIAQRG